MNGVTKACRRGAALFALALACVGAAAQPHERTQGGYTLRASVVSSMDIDGATAKAHDIERSPLHGVLNVTLLRRAGGVDSPLPARVEARITNLLGAHHSVDLHEQRVQAWVSYYGGFRHAPGEVLDFAVSAQPQGEGPRLALAFRERMGGRAGR